MPTNIPPLVIPPRRALVPPMRRPFNVDKDCLLCLLPDINSTWLDQSAEGNDGTITSATLKHSGRFGPCLYFDGTNDTVNCGTDASLDITDYFTLSVWFYPHTLPVGAAESKICEKNWNELHFRIDDLTSNLRGYSALASDLFYSTYTLPAAAKWYHAVMTIKSGAQVLYVNGVSRATASETGAITVGTTRQFRVGSNRSGTAAFFKGYIDEVVLIHRYLSASEVLAWYQMGKPG